MTYKKFTRIYNFISAITHFSAALCLSSYGSPVLREICRILIILGLIILIPMFIYMKWKWN